MRYHPAMHFDLTDLRLFVLTAEEGKLTRAADANRIKKWIEQSALARKS